MYVFNLTFLHSIQGLEYIIFYEITIEKLTLAV
jgi:hypothetical protein